MGTPGIMPTLFSATVLWILLTAPVPNVSATSNICDVVEHNTFRTTEKCNKVLELSELGWALDLGSTPGKNWDDDCEFIRTTEDTVKDCCEGWSTYPACDTPHCDECVNGDCVAGGTGGKPYCRCDEHFTGPKCDEDTRELSGLKQYCYDNADCTGERSNSTQPQSECCAGNSGGSWGSSSQCITCPDDHDGEHTNETVSAERDRVTCMTAGEDIYRTFDDARFTYYSTCTVALLKSSSGMEIYSRTMCEAMNKCSCRKVVTVRYIQNNVARSLLVEDDTVTVTGPDGTSVIPITSSKSSIGNNIVFKMEDESVYFWILIEELSFRIDPSGLFMLTLMKNSLLAGTFSGICGNADGISQDDQANLQELFEENTVTSAPCGAGFQACPDDLKEEAMAACGYMHSRMFKSCVDHGVDSTPFYALCMRTYCSARFIGKDKAELGRCNVLDMFAQTCYKEAHVAINWRSQNFCPKTCPEGKVYEAVIHTNCPLTCGKSAKSYFHESCKTDGHAGCVCPHGKARINDTCLEPAQCQCVGDDNRYYNIDDTIQSADKCLKCTCGAYGLWDCEDSRAQCMGSCSVLGNTVHTFDGLTYAFEADSCALTLMQDQTGGKKIELLAKDCSGGVTCLHGVRVTVDGVSGSVIVGSDGEFITDNAFGSLDLFIRKVSQDYYAIDLNPGVRVFVSTSGMVHVAAQSALFKDMTYGLCGTLNGDIKDELMSTQRSVIPSGEFLSVYSDCKTAAKKPIDKSINSALCDSLDDASLPATGHVNLDTIKKLCNYKDTRGEQCQVLKALALTLRMSMVQLFGDGHQCVQCEEREREVCDSNCLDLAYPYCREETIYDCGCGDGQYYKDNDCVNKMGCGCYDLNTTQVIHTGQTLVTGCIECTCTGFQLECESACEDVICAGGQTPWSEIKHDPNCTRKMCPKQYEVKRECVSNARRSQQCYCPENMHQTQTDECVEFCPCYENGWRAHNDTVTKHCKTKTCNDGNWKISEASECTGVCILSGSPMRLKGFDQDALSDSAINGNCEYTVFSAGDYTVKVKAMFCGSGSQGCGYKVTIAVGFLTKGPIELFRGMDGVIMYNGQTYTRDLSGRINILSTGIYTDITFEDKLTIRWSEGVTAQIIVNHGAFSNIHGLCGNFDGVTTNDYVGEDNNPVMSLAEVAKNWADMNLCVDTKPPVEDNKCEENSRKKQWAETSCNVIASGDAFSACRNSTNPDVVHTYFDNCVNSACTCESGGDCECLCDAIASFAGFCSDAGFPARYRHQRLCPIQCDGGSQYQACGEPCPAICGAEPTECEKKPCVEGCFCPGGYMRSNSGSLECVPQSECPCTLHGRTVSPGHTLTVDCRQCRCENGTLSCEGESCEKPCEKEEFRCLSGHCIRRSMVCNAMFDCLDGSDEKDCISTNCTEFKCANGQCIELVHVCDSYPDCMDGSDEAGCEKTCGADEFKCKSYKHCIPKNWLCDEYPDCSDGSDELDCAHCPENYTHCNQTYCAPIDRFCDGHDDCGDGSDEVGCTTPASTTRELFMNNCIFHSFL
ncbi:mucin-6-like [Babylonia areolata]|uniref:mucin-6-like n=1 Tax=Babylonia areolata TaxID=304850 RepID=UPI003FD5763B